MRLKQLVMLVLMMVVGIGTYAQTTVTIGTGTGTARFPLGKLFGFERSVSLYLASEINTSGRIDQIGWNIGTAGTGTVPVRIRLATIAATTTTLTANTFANFIAGSSVVFFDTAVAPTPTGWFTLNLQSSFNYNGSDNLLVMVETNFGGGGGAGSPALLQTAVTGRHLTWAQDNTVPTGNGATSSNRPNIRLRITPSTDPDLRVSALLSNTLAACNSSTYDLSYRIINSGGGAIPSGDFVRFGYRLNNGTNVLDSIQLTSALAINGTLDVAFNGISVGTGSQTFRVWAGNNRDLEKSNDSSTFTIVNPNCISTNYFTDLEADNGGWQVNGDVWEWGAIAKGALNSPPSGTRGWITQLSVNYPNNANASLESPFFNFSTSCVPVLQWSMRFVTENNWDAMILEATTDNVNWVKVNAITPAYNNNSALGPIAPDKFSGNNNAWATYEADLRAFAQQPVVRVRFRFGSDGSGNEAGFAIDNIRMTMVPSYSGTAFTMPDTATTNVLLEGEILNQSPQATGITFQWLVNDVPVASTYHLNHRFPAAGTFNVKLRVRDACNAVLDSLTQIIVVVDPTAAPVPDFIANKNAVSAFENITFTNLTTGGASFYEWYVNPEVIIDPLTGTPLQSAFFDNGTTPNSRIPQISFLANGVYDICLIAENSLGRDTTCKTAYIVVGSGQVGASADSLMCSGTSSTALRGRLYDSGGPNGDYQNSQNCTFTIDFSCYDSLVMNLASFNLENNFDFLRVFDGPAGVNPLWNTATFPNGMTGNQAIPPVLGVARSGLVTIVMTTDISVTAPGFVMDYEMRSAKTTPTAAAFTIPDTSCAGYEIRFTNQSVNANRFFWNFVGTSTIQSTETNPGFTYGNGGNFAVKLIAVGCGGSDTLIKNVTILNPAANTVNFGARFTRVTTRDLVNLIDSTDGCIDDRLWTITPNTVNYVNGNNQSIAPSVRFTQPGFYSINLEVYNAAGADALLRTNYIEVIDICTPVIQNNNADLGISRVVLHTIDHRTNADLGYMDYPAVSTELEKGRTYNMSIHRQTTSNNQNRKVWVDWNADGDFDDAGEEVFSEASSRNAVASFSLAIPTTAHNGMVTMRVSSSYQTQPNTPCGTRAYGETEDYRLILIPDVIAPVITLLGLDTVIINRNDSYADAGATAMDNLDGNLTSLIQVGSNVNTTVAGTYQVTYDVADAAGNSAAQVVRTVIVLPDAPVLSLLGNDPDTLNVFASYLDLGANAVDFANVQLTVEVISNLNKDSVGTYTITYRATDRNGRSSSINRQVVVVDRVAPTAALVGNDTITVEVFGNLVDPGVKATDNYCDEASLVVSASTVDLTTLGVKTITYTIEDCFGNSAQITRAVRVIDTEAPSIELVGSISANVIRLRTYTDSGYVVNDNYDAAANITVTTITNLVDTETPGLYTLRYRATDASGNSSLSEIRFIYVLDNVGIENMIQSNLEVYPNPNRGRFTLNHDEFAGQSVNLRMVDVTGRLVLNQQLENFSGTQELNVQENGKGVYMIFLTVGNQQAVARVVIQ